MKLNVKRTKNIAIGDTVRDLHLEDGKGTISHVNEYTYLGVRITNDGNGEPEINDRISRGRAAITKLNGILWDCFTFLPRNLKFKGCIYREFVI